eukprot:15454633-Alexandrium_andersonii.AAC.1
MHTSTSRGTGGHACRAHAARHPHEHTLTQTQAPASAGTCIGWHKLDEQYAWKHVAVIDEDTGRTTEERTCVHCQTVTQHAGAHACDHVACRVCGMERVCAATSLQGCPHTKVCNIQSAQPHTHHMQHARLHAARIRHH